MNQKGPTKAQTVVLLVVLVAVVGYFMFTQKAPSETKLTPNTVDWTSSLSDMRTALKATFSDQVIEESRPISVYKVADITDDAVPEVLVNLGTGGAATDFFTVMTMKNGKPVVPVFKQKDGKVSALVFSAGAGGAGRYGSSVEMMPDTHALSYASYSKYGTSMDYCRADAYQWNSETNVFEYSGVLSTEVQKNYCRTAETNL